MTPQFTIKNNAKLPPKRNGRGRPLIYPFASMKVGQVAEFPDLNKKSLARVRAAMYSYGNRHGLRFTTRFTDKGVFLAKRIPSNA